MNMEVLVELVDVEIVAVDVTSYLELLCKGAGAKRLRIFQKMNFITRQ